MTNKEEGFTVVNLNSYIKGHSIYEYNAYPFGLLALRVNGFLVKTVFASLSLELAATSMADAAVATVRLVDGVVVAVMTTPPLPPSSVLRRPLSAFIFFCELLLLISDRIFSWFRFSFDCSAFALHLIFFA